MGACWCMLLCTLKITFTFERHADEVVRFAHPMKSIKLTLSDARSSVDIVEKKTQEFGELAATLSTGSLGYRTSSSRQRPRIAVDKVVLVLLDLGDQDHAPLDNVLANGDYLHAFGDVGVKTKTELTDLRDMHRVLGRERVEKIVWGSVEELLLGQCTTRTQSI
ncbi:hypothetical protein BT96DRAFT_938796 [Gymnopus androsaceus JB14]|uniref:Uncharacterized protein n=1 Tax=Gymnopus androsaceus JB14 TaxID=1447944 RepID=A0A6A4HPC5_9AGAR|nr:hypothetical protein BT96DRAFT_938796 [Gymnopus androsaceus JB14]